MTHPARWQRTGFALYVHWPFCLSKCPYCDFNSHVSASIDMDRWQNAYLAELDRAAAETPDRRLSSIFFGGGTPSLMEPSLVGAIIERATALWTPANDIEITLEANPTSVEAARFQGFRAAGVNRVSVGVQALNDDDLRKLGRMHSADEALRAVDTAMTTFDRVSFDLIYARQDQSAEAWEAELARALAVGTDHLSLYQLTVEPGTVFGARFDQGKLKGLPDDDMAADMYGLTQEMTAAAGLPCYEISNHARPGSESRHNMIYWLGGDYAGVGPGAHGRLTDAAGIRRATVAKSAPIAWLDQVETKGHGEVTPREVLSPGAQRDEYLLMSLRLVKGTDLTEMEAISGRGLDPAAIAELEELGLLQRTATGIAATAEGRLVLNGLISRLLGQD